MIDAYRPIEDQYRLADELGLYSEGGWAAKPGTSQHGWGRAIDLELDDDALAWMRRNAGAYGFTMASNYNSRARAAEVMIDGDQHYCIRERETLSDLLRGETTLP